VNSNTWLARRAALAVALLVGFYLFGIVIALGLLAIPVAEWVYLDRVHVKLLVFCVGGGAAILWALVPRRDRFTVPGPRLDEASSPRLFSLVHNIAARLNQEVPTETFLLHDVNAWVTHRGGVMGFGSRRVMGIGLPLLQCLSIREFAAVVAHEFGHFSSGDVRLGPWIYKTRAAIGRTLAGLRDSALQAPFKWYARQFLKLTHGVSRQQEFLADRVAARAVGRLPLASALRRIAAISPAYRAYLDNEVLPVMQAGFLPPVASGFEQFLAENQVEADARQAARAAEQAGPANEFDTHPSLAERVAALESVATDGPPTHSAEERASDLLGDLDGRARALLEQAAGSEALQALKPIGWEQVAEAVYEKRWRDTAARHAKWLGTFVADRLPVARGDFIGPGSDLVGRGEENVNSEERVARAAYVLGTGLGVLLMNTGWRLQTGPGRPLVLARGPDAFDPVATLRSLTEGRVTREQWAAQCQELGIAGRSLDPGTDSPGTVGG